MIFEIDGIFIPDPYTIEKIEVKQKRYFFKKFFIIKLTTMHNFDCKLIHYGSTKFANKQDVLSLIKTKTEKLEKL